MMWTENVSKLFIYYIYYVKYYDDFAIVSVCYNYVM